MPRILKYTGASQKGYRNDKTQGGMINEMIKCSYTSEFRLRKKGRNANGEKLNCSFQRSSLKNDYKNESRYFGKHFTYRNVINVHAQGNFSKDLRQL